MLKKMTKIKLIIVFIILMLTLLLLVFLRNKMDSSENSQTFSTYFENIEVNLTSSEIFMEILEGEENRTEIRVVSTGRHTPSDITIEESENSLSINQKLSRHLFDFGSDLKIYVQIVTKEDSTPLGKINISSESGRITIENFIAEDITIHSKSGKIKADNLLTNNISLSTSSGDLIINGAKLTEKLSLQSESGSINLKDIETKILKVQSQSGAINIDEINSNYVQTKTESGTTEITFFNALNGIIAESSSISGNIKYIFQNDILLSIEHEGEKIGIDSGIILDENSSNKINLITNSGSLSVKRR